MELDQEKIRKLFEKYDKNKNDTLEKREFVVGFREMLSQIGENMPEKKHEQVAMEGIKEFDLNGNVVSAPTMESVPVQPETPQVPLVQEVSSVAAVNPEVLAICSGVGSELPSNCGEATKVSSP